MSTCIQCCQYIQASSCALIYIYILSLSLLCCHQSQKGAILRSTTLELGFIVFGDWCQHIQYSMGLTKVASVHGI
jgi:hypothetical protein